ncbi:ribosome-binding factor A [Candidatus Parcubacteria bacterium]|nr:ribosome-binding factor A [Candidatus Parcubacteria bacterium]
MMEPNDRSLRQEKAIEGLRRAAAEFLEMESNKTTLITVTRATIAPDFKRATLFITVLPEEREAQALDFARRKLKAFREFAKERLNFRQIPFFSFELDKGDKVRRKIDELGKK